MRTNPQRAAHVAIKSAVASDAISYTGLTPARQTRRNKSLEKVTGRAIWFNTPALNVTKNHTEVKLVDATQKLSESDLPVPILCVAR